MEKGKQQLNRAGLVSLLIVGVAAFATVTSAQAAASLQLTDGRHTLTLNETAGVISYSGTLGKFSLNITTNPAVGDALLPSMNFSLTAGRNAGALTLYLSNTSIATLPGQLSASIKGQTDGSVVFSTGGSSSNSIFAMNSPFTTSSLNGSFNKTSVTNVALNGPFSLTEKILITPGSRSGVTSFSTSVVDPPISGGQIAAVPDTGSTLMLLA